MSQQFSLSAEDFGRLGRLLPPELSKLANEVPGNLVELVPRQFVLEEVKKIQIGQLGMYSRYLSGAGGVGKTTALALIVMLLLRENVGSIDPVLVVYHPLCSNCTRMTPAESCSELLDSLTRLNVDTFRRVAKFSPLAELLHSDRPDRKKWDGFIKLVKMNNDWKVLFALDQWNALFEVPLPPDHPLVTFERIFPSLSDKSVLFTAVSSSFTALDAGGRAFRDNEAATSVLQVPPLDHAEGIVLLQIWRHRFPSISISDNEMKMAMEKTGGIP